jgi:uncharacterized membrane protein YczE
MARDMAKSFAQESPKDFPPGPDGVIVYPHLALSGGGANGAFGAGFLNGWTSTGTRPVFKVVTGVSTGALMAPFAFLGPAKDEALIARLNELVKAKIEEAYSRLLILPELSEYWQQLGTFVLGVVVVAIATGLYISSRLGSGPRDGLMQGTANALDKPFWIVRTAYEASALTLGWLMGGQVREGTLIFALTIGYLVQISLRVFKIPKG